MNQWNHWTIDLIEVDGDFMHDGVEPDVTGEGLQRNVELSEFADEISRRPLPLHNGAQ